MGITGFLRKRYTEWNLRPMDAVILAYLALIGILVVPFHRDVRNWAAVPFVHAGLCAAVVGLIRWQSSRPGPVLDFVRTFYPVLWICFAWTEMDNLVTMIFPYWANGFVVRADLRIFGVHPTVWVERLFRPWLTELMNFFYTIYYFFIAAIAFPLYFRGKRKETFEFLFLVTFTFAVSFLLFLIFPSEGAWVILRDKHTVEPEGGLFLHFIQWVQSNGTMRGGAFPSSHVAAAFTITLAGLRYNRPMGLVILPLAVGVALATVYCRYHHAVDAIAGIVSGILLYGIGRRILRPAVRPLPGQG
ncbi:phosphatase PAP2 family protein [bacterium]|nr:phosphatase PAP2 family protein [bacterium]